MQNVRGWRGNNEAKVYEEFYPSMDWTQDSTSHILIIDLPGFKREDLKVQIDDTRKLTVYGEKQVAGNKYKRFKNIVTMLQDADIANVSAKFEHGLLFISMPKIMSKSTDKETQRLPAFDPTDKETQRLPAFDPTDKETQRLPAFEETQRLPAFDPTDKETQRLPAFEETQRLPAFDPTDKETQRLPAFDPEKEAATKMVDRKDQEASKKVVPQEKQDDVREEAMEMINKGGQDTHQRVVDNHKDEEDQGGERDDKVDMVKTEEKTLEKCRDGVKEGDDVGEKLRERLRSTLEWIGEKVRGGMEMQEVEGVGGKLLNVARKNKEVIAAAVVAFTFGFYVSKKLSR